jgi:hypothetical protein
MTNESPVACSLAAGELKQRLAAIEEVGAHSLIAHALEANRHVLRFRASPAVRRQLEEIVAAEAECCSFLELSLGEDRGDLVLAISAPEHAKAIADELAGAFVSGEARKQR